MWVGSVGGPSVDSTHTPHITQRPKTKPNTKTPRQDPRVLFLKYEDMKADLRATLQTVAKHLRVEPPPTASELDRLVAACSLDGMRADRGKYEPRSVAWRDPSFRFIRKGEVGDHVGWLTPQQRAAFARGLFERYKGIVGGGGEGVEVGPGLLPTFVTGALVGGEAGLVAAAKAGGGRDGSE